MRPQQQRLRMQQRSELDCRAPVGLAMTGFLAAAEMTASRLAIVPRPNEQSGLNGKLGFGIFPAVACVHISLPCVTLAQKRFVAYFFIAACAGYISTKRQKTS